jgi:hypothetical protein
MEDKIPGLAKPWIWIQPKNDADLIRRLIEAREYAVHERERENAMPKPPGRLRIAACGAPRPGKPECDCGQEQSVRQQDVEEQGAMLTLA